MMIRRWKSDLFKSDLFIPADGSASVFRPRTSADNAANNKSNECIGVAVLKEGQTYTITLSADPSVSSFIVVPQSPLPAAQPTTNPLQFSLTLPTSITPGIYTIGAVGFTSRGLAQPCSRLHYYETGCPTLRGVRSVGTTKSTQCPARTGNRCFIRAENPSAREETSEDLRERKIERDFSTAPHNKIRNSCDIQPLLKPANAPRLDTMRAIDPAQDPNSQARFHAQNLERPNSLFRNILPITRLESRFCAASLTHEPRNSNQSNILQVRCRKTHAPIRSR